MKSEDTPKPPGDKVSGVKFKEPAASVRGGQCPKSSRNARESATLITLIPGNGKRVYLPVFH